MYRVIYPCIDCLCDTVYTVYVKNHYRMVLVTDRFCCLSSSFLIVMYSLSLWQIPVFTGPVHNHQDVLLSFQSIMAAGSSIMPRGTKACVKILTSRFYSWPMRTWNRSFSLSPCKRTVNAHTNTSLRMLMDSTICVVPFFVIRYMVSTCNTASLKV